MAESEISEPEIVPPEPEIPESEIVPPEPEIPESEISEPEIPEPEIPEVEIREVEAAQGDIFEPGGGNPLASAFRKLREGRGREACAQGGRKHVAPARLNGGDLFLEERVQQ